MSSNRVVRLDATGQVQIIISMMIWSFYIVLEDSIDQAIVVTLSMLIGFYALSWHKLPETIR